MSSTIERFLRYVQIDTQSSETSQSFPSTDKQFNLARLLEKELKELGMQDVELDKFCSVTAVLPANIDKKAPVIGFMAHLDTSPDVSGENVHPRIIDSYDGATITLNKEKNILFSPEEFPMLKRHLGQSLIVTDGTTLLGADDKAGMAEIIAAMEHLIQHPELKHGTIKVAFTPDEEIGHGMDHFDAQKFGTDFAYTVDGGELGELNFETFNAASTHIVIKGKQVHPGMAKNIMKNALLIAMELNAMLPVNERPEYTESREGFYHLHQFGGDVERAEMVYIIRDHDRQKFEHKKVLIQQAADFINASYGAGTATCEVSDTYYNLKEKVEPVMHVIDTAQKAMRAVGVEPRIIAVRGGTDGSRLSYMGIPTPNLFTGGFNAHSRFEFVPTAAMEKATEVILKIIELYTE
jgi:tripeptide aminopeptidase